MISELNVFNIGLDLCGIMLCFIGLMGVVICRKIMERDLKIFVAMFIANTLTLFSNMFGLIFKGNMSEFALKAIPVFNFCEFAFSYTMAFLVSIYIIDTIDSKRPLTEFKGGAFCIYVLSIVMLIVSQFNGMYYIVDENNFYQRQDMYWVSQLFGILFMVFDLIIISAYRNSVNRKQKISILCYIFIPSVAMILQIFVYGVYLLLIATSIAVVMMLMIMLSVYVQRYKEKEQEIVESKISIMRSQIKPHFLYNSLTAIASLCDSDPKTAQKATIAFADYLRGNMNSLEQKDLIDFSAELNHIKTYLYLEQLRFADDLKVIYDIKSTDFKVPALSIQPIIENAVKWGVGKKENGGYVKLLTYSTDTDNVIKIEDNGNGFDTSKPLDDGRSHIGISNVSKRIRTMCGGDLHIDSKIGEKTTVTITVPRVRKNENSSK